jgi:hypothetical protein
MVEWGVSEPAICSKSAAMFLLEVEPPGGHDLTRTAVGSKTDHPSQSSIGRGCFQQPLSTGILWYQLDNFLIMFIVTKNVR